MAATLAAALLLLEASPFNWIWVCQECGFSGLGWLKKKPEIAERKSLLAQVWLLPFSSCSNSSAGTAPASTTTTLRTGA